MLNADTTEYHNSLNDALDTVQRKLTDLYALRDNLSTRVSHGKPLASVLGGMRRQAEVTQEALRDLRDIVVAIETLT